MALIGGNTEKKKIGLSIGVSGTHDKTKINKDTVFLELVDIDVDGEGRPIYVEQGSWTSDVIDLGDVFQDFEKVFTDSTVNGASSFAVLTRVSSNNYDWSDWVAIAEDGTIQSDTKQYIQVRIDLFAGFVSDVFIIAKNDFNINGFLEEKGNAGSFVNVTPTLTSNTSSALGFSFASSEYNTTYPAWRAFDKTNTNYYQTLLGQHINGYLGFAFNTQRFSIIRYLVRSISATSYTLAPKNWYLEGSNNTTTGADGTWDILDVQTNQSWTAVSTNKIYDIPRTKKYKAFRLRWTANNGHVQYTAIGELEFFTDTKTSLSLKRDYTYDKKLDSTWSDTGSLHRKLVTRSQWQRIDRLEVL
ncbi:hypothetical protein [Lysinibacillus fusiformis]|uniref:hypothetical protein n=1 Tax=Lysinibacillus fusiformis TaxID=28031 RepID=UPI00148E74C5|nr:hypothetical protein [Lysinibacillus fusiformis]NOG27207.1 hypothetical protein [Lysinibacillus fusiformis]